MNLKIKQLVNSLLLTLPDIDKKGKLICLVYDLKRLLNNSYGLKKDNAALDDGRGVMPICKLLDKSDLLFVFHIIKIINADINYFTIFHDKAELLVPISIALNDIGNFIVLMQHIHIQR